MSWRLEKARIGSLRSATSVTTLTLPSNRWGSYGPQRVLRQKAALDRLLSLVVAEYGTLLMLEGGTGSEALFAGS
jgi:hypothetical protein